MPALIFVRSSRYVALSQDKSRLADSSRAVKQATRRFSQKRRLHNPKRGSERRQQFRRMRLQGLPRLAEFRKNRFDRLPEARTVIHLTQMREFVCDDVIDNGQRKMNQPPVQPNLAVTRTTAPACG